MSRRAKWIKRIILALGASAVAFGIAVGMHPKPLPVETGIALRGPLIVTVDGVGRTRMVDKQTVSAPVGGELSRIFLRPGDAVNAGQVVAEILPSVSQPLDARSRNETRARLGAAKAGLAEAQRNVERAQIALDLAEREAHRARQLLSTQSVPVRTVELAEAEEKARRSELLLSRTTVERARLEAQAVAASLGEPGAPKAEVGSRVEVRALLRGVILRVHNESAGPVQSGSPLMDIGDPGQVELVVDLPTQSAIKVAPGAPVKIDGLGSGAQLQGVVKLVEPGAFTKVTALGVEEQRVNVIVSPTGEPLAWTALGDGFAADAHIEHFKAEDVLKVPGGAVFRNGRGHAVFAVVGKKARLTTIEIGNRSAEEVEVKSGLRAGDTVVVHPSDKLADQAFVVSE